MHQNKLASFWLILGDLEGIGEIRIKVMSSQGYGVGLGFKVSDRTRVNVRGFQGY